MTCLRPSHWIAITALATAPALAQCPVGIDLTPNSFTRFSTGVVAFEKELYFSWDDGNSGLELWKWSPTVGFQLAADVKAGSGTSRPADIAPACTPAGPRIFFTAADTSIDYELFATDGTPGSLYQVAEIRPGSTGSLPHSTIPFGDGVAFVANDGSTGDELWVSDGTGAGTQRVKDIWPGGSPSNPQYLAAVGDLLFFSANDSTGKELWVTDGTEPGTVNLGAQIPSLGQSPYQLTPGDGVLYFTTGNELWKSDGTVAGTTMVQNVKATWNADILNDLTVLGDQLFFVARVAGTGNLLFVSDGTDAGTYQVQTDINTYALSPTLLTPSNGRLFFCASHFQSGRELWVSDGTHSGTVLAADIQAGSSSSNPQYLTPIGSGVVFAADDGTGSEPWFSDGTQAGSFMLCDIDPNGSSMPNYFHIVDGQLFLFADNPAISTEPHVLATPGAHVQRLGHGSSPSYPGLSTLGDAAPILGTTIRIVADDGPPNHAGLLFLGASGLPGPTFAPLMQRGCDWVGLITGTGLAVAAAAGSNLDVPLALPNQASLEGLQFHLQMVWFDQNALPPIQLSNGLKLVLGTATPH